MEKKNSTIMLNSEQLAQLNRTKIVFEKAHGLKPTYGELVRRSLEVFEAYIKKGFPETRG